MALLRILIALYCVWGASGNIFHNETRPQESTQRIRLPNPAETLILQRDDIPKRQTSESNQIISVSPTPGCPPIDGQPSTNTTTGPNGSIFFLNCGISAADQMRGKWRPPNVQISDLVIRADFSSFTAMEKGVFKPCAPYFDAFVNASTAISVPPVLMAAFAMQESGCRPNVTGSGGTAGLLQLSPDKCTRDNCYDPYTNIRIGAEYLQRLLQESPNIVLAVGSWNGWFSGMSYSEATAARDTDCYSQRNLDYLQQYFNGWLQGVNSYGQYGGNQRLGFYFNLDICDRGPSPSDAGSLSPATFSYLIALFVSCLVLLSGV